jgi:hypothetical protein
MLLALEALADAAIGQPPRIVPPCGVVAVK